MQYWDSSGTAQWRDALTWAGNNAVLFCTINKSLGSPSTAERILSNRPKDASSTDTSKSTGIFSGTQDANNRTKATIFNEFQDIRIIEEESGMILFRGRLYHIKSHYDYRITFMKYIKIIICIISRLYKCHCFTRCSFVSKKP